MILEDEQAIKVLESSQQVPNFITVSRDESVELFALLEGDQFAELLINRIEYIESKDKAEARKKYSRDIAHFFQRLLNPTENVYSATGGSKVYKIKDKTKLENLLSKISRIRNGKSLQQWLRATWMPLYHSDPNGVIFMEYSTEGDDVECWPTYKNIDHIRNYKARGQKLEWILFEPVKKNINTQIVECWRLVDDTQDRLYKKEGNQFILIEEIDGVKVSFEHPFGVVPALINSDIEKLKGTHRLSPIDKVVELSKEYARDQSIKTIYKKYNGFPYQWKYQDQCEKCHGAGKDPEGNTCRECDGHGYYKSKDVTDVHVLATPDKEDVILNPSMGFVTPPLDIWTQYDNELELLDKMAHKTHWGTMAGSIQNIAKTATEIILNTQPMIDKLNAYSDTAEFMEGFFTELIANLIDDSKPKDESIASINYGRRYIIDPPDVILEKYENAKKEGDNNVILDRLFNEYLTAKYKNDPDFLRVILLKSKVEPYIHLSVEQVNAIFGNTEAQKKVLFEDWWNTLTVDDFDKTASTLSTEFETWFASQQQTTPTTGAE